VYRPSASEGDPPLCSVHSLGLRDEVAVIEKRTTTCLGAMAVQPEDKLNQFLGKGVRIELPFPP